MPESFWLKVKPFFDWDKLVGMMQLGFQKIMNLFKQSTGVDSSQIGEQIQKTTGVNLANIWGSVKDFFTGIFNKIRGILG